ncbi:MAG: 4-hydroxy-3-methylbut-2-enyl diphosphate reductase [Candidatus Moranbacteria bacterium CG_4_8_14_3_um_filter_34_16]|nr:MAG: 4-hydroxy-3-methylbut-2-enyl diphosphate reductase [Candidatus Moranbacteria bacterium CG08_land_8_20_14_0_20_34_16]PIW95250.1 MAG: 4-hydroxy-3-methylbut-2-enyl diphosphate reductase [Candidatus Moranbacteria bacterium CG_4_8_14_3_um_filter_34_16]PJA89079.1 MAG: 4-hydroxy-3-methylbut-2-enyl diphosphate reductase [Candidatus Moranbacteria bacterium CG_4_9_14_3_um_filter_33_15]
MKIFLSQYAGFCSGVERAFDMVMNLDMEKVKKPVFILGALVHNDDVNRRIKEKGIAEIGLKELRNSLFGEIGTLIITAHGDGPEIFALAKEKGMNVIDTTCPKVIKVQRLAKAFSERGMRVVLAGDKNHKETLGIDSWGGKKSLIVSSPEDFSRLVFSPQEKIAVLSQTTQDKIFFEKICRKIKKNNPSAIIENTICLTSRNRQKEVKKLAKKNDAVVVIGSPHSANSKRLFEIARRINKKTFFVENVNQIEKKWFEGIDAVGVIAGASTPEWIIKEILEKIKKM